MTNDDGLLAERFTASYDSTDRSDWNDVLRRRPGRRRRVRAAGVLVALAAVVVPAAVAIGGPIHQLFFGAPAPPIVKRAFTESNEMRALMQKWQQRHPNSKPFASFPTVEAQRAHGVIAVKTNEGLLLLWAAPAAHGRQCWFVDFAVDQVTKKRPTGIGSCDAQTPPADKITLSYSWSAEHPAFKVLSGRLYVAATAVLVRSSSGAPRRIPVVDHFFLAAFPRNTKLPRSISAVNADGHVVATFKR